MKKSFLSFWSWLDFFICFYSYVIKPVSFLTFRIPFVNIALILQLTRKLVLIFFLVKKRIPKSTFFLLLLHKILHDILINVLRSWLSPFLWNKLQVTLKSTVYFAHLLMVLFTYEAVFLDSRRNFNVFVKWQAYINMCNKNISCNLMSHTTILCPKIRIRISRQKNDGMWNTLKPGVLFSPFFF